MDVTEFLNNPNFLIVSEQIRELIKSASEQELQELVNQVTNLLSIAIKEQDDAISVVEFHGGNLVLNANITKKMVYIHSVEFFLDELGEIMSKKHDTNKNH